jgi:hypothetical protein
MPKQSNNDEQRLLNHASLDELIKIKMEEELKAEMEKAKIKPEKQIITNISEVPENLIFSKQSVFKFFNRVNKLETYINGVQAEAMLGLQTAIRTKIKAGEMDAFSTDNAYIKFEKIEI